MGCVTNVGTQIRILIPTKSTSVFPTSKRNMEGNVRLPLLPPRVVVLKKNEQYVNNIWKSCIEMSEKVEIIYILKGV